MDRFPVKKILNYEIRGEGYPVVFLHGFLESNSMWNYLPLEKFKVQCILIELPGHGASSLSTGTPSIGNFVDRVYRTLQHLGIEKCSIVGHSMGGYVALEMKKKFGFVDNIILLNSNYWADSKEKAIDRHRIANFIQTGKNIFLKEAIPNLFLHKEEFKKDVRALIEEAKGMTPDAIAYASIAMAKRKRNYHLMLEARETVYVIQGEKDSVAPKALWNPAIVDNNPNYFEIKDCGHMAHIEKSLELTEILDFIFRKICSA